MLPDIHPIPSDFLAISCDTARSKSSRTHRAISRENRTASDGYRAIALENRAFPRRDRTVSDRIGSKRALWRCEPLPDPPRPLSANAIEAQIDLLTASFP
jgi:hypothetical protein